MAFAVVNIKDKQYRVSENQKLIVDLLDSEEGSEVTFDKVYFLQTEEGSKIGTPFVEGAKVQAKILKQFKADKIVVFKKKRRKGYRKKQGHRQNHMLIQISKIA